MSENNDLLYVQQEYDRLARVVKEVSSHLDTYVKKFDALDPLDEDLLTALNLLSETPLLIADELIEAKRVADLEAAVEKAWKVMAVSSYQTGAMGDASKILSEVLLNKERAGKGRKQAL